MDLTPDQFRVLSELADQLLAEEQAIAERQAKIDADEVALGEVTIEAQQGIQAVTPSN